MRLIDADALMEKLFEIWHEYKSDTIASDGLSRAIKAIRRATTVHEAGKERRMRRSEIMDGGEGE